MNAPLTSTPGATERELFIGALGQADPAARDAYLRAVCGDHPALRRRLEELLQEESLVGGFLERPVLADASGAAPGATRDHLFQELTGAVTEQAGDRIGPYKLLEKIGEGGCGLVYMAEQETPVRRRVALKIIKLGMDTRNVIARFEAERQALAMMDHPNIAKVLDAGASETGRPYFVMELVRGVKITDYCDQNHLPATERLALFLQVCHGIQHAHQKGIIHRDIKPSNILVTLHDSNPVPKVIDFGIAKALPHLSQLTDKTLFTAFTAFIGTPAYMSPEQAEMSGLDIDTRSDIYALGVLLYELLTGQTPFDARALLDSGLDACRRTILEREPDRPSTRLARMPEAELTTTARHRRTEAPRLVHLLRGDLDWVVMKCLEKDRARRYATASDLALDVQRHLDHEPVIARPPGNWYRWRKFCRRHRGAVSAAAAIAAALIAGAGLSAWQAVRATRAERLADVARQQENQLRQQAQRERQRALENESLARLNEYVADMNLAHQSLASGNLGRAIQLVDKHRPKPGAPDLRGFEWRYLWELCQGDDHQAYPNQDGWVQSLAFSPDGGLLAVGLREKLNIWNTRTKSLVASLDKGAYSLAFLPDGQRLVSASLSTVRVWRASDWTLEILLADNSSPIALSKDGLLLATLCRFGVRLWDTSTWRERRFLQGASGPLAFAPNGETLATETQEGIRLWPLKPDGAALLLEDSANINGRWGAFLGALAFSPDGRTIVAARNGHSKRGAFVLDVWDARTGKEIAVMPADPQHVEHTGVIPSMVISPDGRTLATASCDYSVRLWDLATHRGIGKRQGHLNEVWAVAYSPDGEFLASGAKNGGLNLWPRRQPGREDLLTESWQPLGFSPDSRRLAGVDRQGKVAFLNLATREPEREIPWDVPALPLRRDAAFGGDLNVLRQGLEDGTVRIWQAETGETNLLKVSDRRLTSVLFSRRNAALSGHLNVLAQGMEDGTVKIWQMETGETNFVKVSDRRVTSVALSPDGRHLIAGSHDQGLAWWDLRYPTNVLPELEARRVIFSPDGRVLAAFPHDRQVQFWHVATHTRQTTLAFDEAIGDSAALSPDGALLATTTRPDDAVSLVRLWDTATGRLLGACVGHSQSICGVAFAPDDKTLASASTDSTLRLWNVATQQELLASQRLGVVLTGLMFSPDGQWLIGNGNGLALGAGLIFHHAPPFSQTDAARVSPAP